MLVLEYERQGKEEKQEVDDEGDENFTDQSCETWVEQREQAKHA